MTTAAALDAIAAHYRSMPPVATMDISILGYDGETLRLHAPLARHVNDKGCAFGGSLVSLMTLAGWGLVTLHLEQAGIAADVFVADSDVRYLAPLYADLQTEARLDGGASWDDFIATLRQRGRARATLRATVPLPAGGIATECTARYVAIAKA
jgi:thioesterase domain-containing protein